MLYTVVQHTTVHWTNIQYVQHTVVCVQHTTYICTAHMLYVVQQYVQHTVHWSDHWLVQQ